MRAATRVLAAAAGAASAQLPPPPRGDVTAVAALLERVVPGSSSHFVLNAFVDGDCAPGVAPPCWAITDGPGGTVAVTATSASEMTAGVGAYLRDFANITIGWPRAGGSRTVVPSPWPAVGGRPFARRRLVPYSYEMNVCTHSYSLAWYSWAQWEQFIDRSALAGINLLLAMTGQEEVQYQVFSGLGLDDMTIRSWFNGPAFLTWSRGQNEYGNNIAGPLPRSFMKAQHALAIQILTRYRSLGITGELPGFQANVPWALAAKLGDKNITQQGDTGWMYSTDPYFAQISDAWMKQLIGDFGTDHWYQLDGYFDGGTAGWLSQERKRAAAIGGPRPGRAPRGAPAVRRRADDTAPLPPCVMSAAQPGTYLAGCDNNCADFATVAEAIAACIADEGCGGITVGPGAGDRPQLRQGNTPQASPSGETSYYIVNDLACRSLSPDPTWIERGTAAYAGLARTDPLAVWSFQGWAIIDWDSAVQASQFRGFVNSTPPGRFVVIDMSVDGSGEWSKWLDASFFGAPFVWTTLHDFGGTDGMKGNLTRVNELPFAGLAPNTPTSVIGTGYTPEGIDQNPIYYEFVEENNWRTAPVPDVTAWAVRRAHRRYGLVAPAADVTAAWTAFAGATYQQDISVQDGTGIAHMRGDNSQFAADRRTPGPTLCATFHGWAHLLAAVTSAPGLEVAGEPFRYDLVNAGREVLAQLSTPMSQNFSDALDAKVLRAADLQATGAAYIGLLNDVDALVGADAGFLLGSWLEMAKALAAPGDDDCAATLFPGLSCPQFYEWNARCQITTWNPTPAGATSIPGGPIDYSSRHYNGLIADYYGVRSSLVLAQALVDAAAGRPLNQTAVDQIKATHAVTWQTSNKLYPTTPVGDAVALSQQMFAKYSGWFASC